MPSARICRPEPLGNVRSEAQRVGSYRGIGLVWWILREMVSRLPLDTHSSVQASGQVDYIRVMNRKRLSLRSPLNERRKSSSQEEQKEE